MGGTEYPFTHLMYIPIIISAYMFMIKGALGTAILGGFILGPFMPENVSNHIQQDLSNWLFRLCIYIVISVVIGYLFERLKLEHKVQIEKSYIYELTGCQNARKLKLDLSQMINQQKSFSVMIFKIKNMDQINRYVDYSIGEKSLLKAIELMACFVNREKIYSIYIDEFAVALWDSGIEVAKENADAFLDCFKEPILIEGIPVTITMKCGITSYPLHSNNSEDLFKNLGRALDQTEFRNTNAAIYNHVIANDFKAKFEIVSSLYEAIKLNQFSIVYQPIFNLKSGNIDQVEALLRWKNSQNLRPDEFIKVAEDAGIISEITKWVIIHVVDQLVEWEKDKLKIKVAINVSSKDLNNDAVIQFAANYMQKCKIDPVQIELELTERAMIENENQIEFIMSRLKQLGIKISLDDFGTGYNSLVQLIKLPIDYMKIDKFFVDHIQTDQHHSLIKELIILAHNLGIEVIAEGVETETQLEQLRKLSCDYIQGYYISKPLGAEELTEYIKNN